MDVSDLEFLKKVGIDSGRIVKMYLHVLRRLHQFINVKKIAQDILVDGRMLKTAVYDYFVDIARVKDFQGIENVNTEKVYGYMAYWLLRRKPIQVVRPFAGSEFINELFVAMFTVSNVLTEKDITIEQRRRNATFQKFQTHLYYHLKYRPVTQQSLELVIGAFFAGCDFQDAAMPIGQAQTASHAPAKSG